MSAGQRRRSCHVVRAEGATFGRYVGGLVKLARVDLVDLPEAFSARSRLRRGRRDPNYDLRGRHPCRLRSSATPARHRYATAMSTNRVRCNWEATVTVSRLPARFLATMKSASPARGDSWL